MDYDFMVLREKTILKDNNILNMRIRTGVLVVFLAISTGLGAWAAFQAILRYERLERMYTATVTACAEAWLDEPVTVADKAVLK
jgi:hypothetical protein